MVFRPPFPMANVSTTKPLATPDDARERQRGRHATRPSEVPKEGWLDILSLIHI